MTINELLICIVVIIYLIGLIVFIAKDFKNL
jgi:hypothetical protein